MLFDVDNDSVLYVLADLTEDKKRVLKLSMRAQNGVIEIVSIFKVKQIDIEAGLKAGQYEVIQ